MNNSYIGTSGPTISNTVNLYYSMPKSSPFIYYNPSPIQKYVYLEIGTGEIYFEYKAFCKRIGDGVLRNWKSKAIMGDNGWIVTYDENYTYEYKVPSEAWQQIVLKHIVNKLQ